MTTKNKIRAVCDLAVAALTLTAVLCGYLGFFDHMGEYCFLSGVLVGLFFTASFISAVVRKKFFPEWLYCAAMLTLLIIFIATVAIGLNLDGAFIFIHIVNPLVIFLYWCVFCDHTSFKNRAKLLVVLVFPLCYMLFSFIMYKATGNCAFPANMVFVEVELWQSLLEILALAAILAALSFIFDALNRLVHKLLRKNNKIHS